LGDETVISSQDRSGFFGASDTGYIMGNWNTKSFQNWWLTKLGINTSQFRNVAMNAGTYYEHAILNVIGSPRKDHQIIIPEYRLRINLDGDGHGRIDEVKTYANEKVFKVTKGYWQQVQVQMFAKLWEEGKVPEANIWAYGLLPEDYKNFFNPVDRERLKNYPIDYDNVFIEKYLHRVLYLKDCMGRGVMPNEKFSM
jgi:hypothetical protein